MSVRHCRHRSRPSTVLAAVAFPLSLAALAAVRPADAEAQHERRYATLGAPRHVQSVVPRIGPPGTEVEVYTENLPPQAKIWVGVGAMRSGFEARAEGRQEMWGEVSATVSIPRYATWDRPLVVIIFNGVFSPIAYSDPFHVTTAEGRVQRTGQIVGRAVAAEAREVLEVGEGAECVFLRDNDEYIYALSGGGVEELEPDDHVIVEGPVAESGPCGGLDTIAVERWERTKDATNPRTQE